MAAKTIDGNGLGHLDTAVSQSAPAAVRAQTAATVIRVRRGPIDVPLMAVTLALTSLGIVMIYSASSVVAELRFGDPNYFLSRQIGGVALGLGAMILAMRIDYRWYRRLAYPMLGLAFVLLLLVQIPGLGHEVNNARRWLSLGGLRFQPSEYVKLTAAIYLAYSVSKKDVKMRYFTLAFIPHLAVIGGLVVLLMPQPDFGSSALLMVLMGLMLFLGGARVSYLVGFLLGGAVLAYDAIISSPYRMERIQAYLNPEAFRQGSAWQVNESFLALGAGGTEGLGLGEGHLKLGYVPELWNDFIGTIIGHELGMVGIAIVIVLFLIFLWRGIHISHRAKEPFGAFLAFGLAAFISLQAAINLGVVVGLLPTKGLTLPLVSYGRSSTIVTLFAVGILLNIAQNNDDLWQHEKERKAEAKLQNELDRRRQRMIENQKRVKVLQ